VSISVCIGYTNRSYENMARVAGRTIMRHTPGATLRLVRCQDKGYRRNMGTRFDAYVDESADWVLAIDADSLCFGDINPIVRRAEQDGYDFLGRLSGRPRRAPRSFNRQHYCQLFRQAGLAELALHVPNVFLIRGHHSAKLAELATRWTEHLYKTETHLLGRPLWSDQVAFTLALAELRLPPGRLGFFHGTEVADWGRARRMSPRPTIIHFGGRRWRRLWNQGRILGLIQ